MVLIEVLWRLWLCLGKPILLLDIYNIVIEAFKADVAFDLLLEIVYWLLVTAATFASILS